jgi:hypothetical protein
MKFCAQLISLGQQPLAFGKQLRVKLYPTLLQLLDECSSVSQVEVNVGQVELDVA